MRFFNFFLCVMLCCISCKTSTTVPISQVKKQEVFFFPSQKKYAAILEVSPDRVNNQSLYEFIEEWEDTPYLMGGETKRGIDCSFFMQILFHKVYDNLIERTAEKQYTAKDTDKFLGQEFLKEGDLLFFNLQGSDQQEVTHVGMYLANDKFVHSTSRKDRFGKNGVQISDLKDHHWQRLFVAAGRKPIFAKQ